MVLFDDLFFAGVRFMSYLFDHNIFFIGMPWSLTLTTYRSYFVIRNCTQNIRKPNEEEKKCYLKNCVCSSNCKINIQQNCLLKMYLEILGR